MAESHIISGLVSKRSELAGLLDHHRKEMELLAQQLATLDAAIKLFEPDYRIQSIKPKRYHRKNTAFKHGEAQKLLLDIIRRAGKPISTIDVAEEAVRRKQLELDSKQLLAFKSTIGGSLIRYRASGLIVEIGKEKGVSIWSIA